TFGASRSTRRSPKWISPRVGSSKPAIRRSSVVLPQPEGPRSVSMAPFSTARSTSSTATTAGAPSAPGNSLRNETSLRSTATTPPSEPHRGGRLGPAPDERADHEHGDQDDRQQQDAERRGHAEAPRPDL